MVDLNDYFYFVHVVEKGGFSRAAESLNIPKSRISRHISQLETRLDVKLIERTSRQFEVTELGRAFYQKALAVIEGVELAESAVSQRKASLSGNVSITCSVGIAQYALQGLLTQFLIDNPLVDVSQQVTNQSVDLISSGIDLAIRGHASPLPDSSYIQRHLAHVTWYLYASPQYLDECGVPTKPSDLSDHQSLKVGWQERKGEWMLQCDNQHIAVGHSPRLCSDDMSTLVNAAEQGAGIVSLPAYICRDAVKRQTLVRVLPDWHTGQAALSLMLPSRRSSSPVVRSLSNYLLENVKAEVGDQR